MKWLSLPAAALGAGILTQPGVAAPALRNNAGEAFCSLSDSNLYRRADGFFYAIFSASFAGDASKASYPGGKPLLQAHPDLKPFLVISYRLVLNAQGAPAGLQPLQMRASAGRISGDLPRGDLGLRILAGSLVSPPAKIDSGAFIVSNLKGELNTPEYAAGGPAVAPAELGRLAAASQRGPRWLSVTRAGQEIARLPLQDPDRSADGPRLQKIRAAIPLLRDGNCP
jgi:hypothetical protein